MHVDFNRRCTDPRTGRRFDRLKRRPATGRSGESALARHEGDGRDGASLADRPRKAV